MREVLTANRQIQKFIPLVAIRDRFEVLVGVKIHGHDYLKPFTSGSFDVEHGNPILDL
jgi:hypothetical protein